MSDSGTPAPPDAIATLRAARWTGIVIVALPFILFNWMTPGLGDKTIGKDYTLYTPNEQLNLLFSLRKGSFPLYAPGYWFGQSASALTLSQIYHPVTWVSCVLPKYWDGSLIACMTMVKLLTLGLAQLALFALLCRMRFKVSLALLLSLVTVYNYRMLDLFRYNASLENYTGMLFLCAAAGWYYLEPARKLAPFAIVAATYWTLTGGHPQMAYYGLAGASVWIVVFPMVARTMVSPVENGGQPPLRFWMKSAVFMAAGGALAACYALPYYIDFVRENSARAKQSYGWSALLTDTPQGTLANWFLPLRADVHSAFGSTSLFIAGAFGLAAGIWNQRTRNVCLLLGALMTILILYALGEGTPFHRWCWNYVPFCSAMRGPGRVFQIMPVVLMLGLMTIISNAPWSDQEKGGQKACFAALIVAFATYLLCPLLPLWNESTMSPFAALKINGVAAWRENLVFVVGAVALVLMVLQMRLKQTGPVSAALCAATALQIFLLLPCGTWTLPAALIKKPTFEQMAQGLSQRLALPDFLSTGMEAPLVTRHLAEGGEFDTRMAAAYPGYRNVSGSDEAIRMLREAERRTPLRPDEPLLLAEEIPGFAAAAKTEQEYRIQLAYSSYNRLEFTCSATPAGGLFKLNYPFSDKWTCRVNGEPAKIFLANNAEMAVQIPPQNSSVEFRYWSPAAAWGWAISCLTLALLAGAGIISAFAVRGWRRAPAFLGPLALSGGLFALWHQSIYAGENLKTVYAYNSRDAEVSWQRRAIAFDRGNGVPIQKSFRRLLSGRADAVPHWVEYDFVLSAPGDYQFALNYLSAQPSPMKLAVNGQILGMVANGVSDPVPEWHAEKMSIHFNAGRNTVRLESAPEGGMPALYKLRFTRQGGARP